MNREGRLPADRKPDEDPLLSAGLKVAMQWADVGTDQLKAALEAMEPELVREHRVLLQRLKMQREAEQQYEERREQRAHRRQMTEVIVGAVLALAMLGAGVYVAADAWWLATLLCGPSLLALAKVFVLRRSDPDDMKHLSRAARTSTNAAGQAQPPPPQ
ncbi:hypothetical protein [Streptomyces sp. CC224B]|uniref:hypothetical protein n=1 Tax=Streptomyces sp. CC224B TaxID=3044571 RepID=UPI0024A7BB1F|nr:hypothetical protein [Streptomyces sp. CC224B]